ncbi:MAG: DUF819 family protein [Bacteroidales bacterium]|jgi:uncharacterized membrane protein|nr:DUF819 family protein [Bacteroidales bacterium]
MIVAIILSIFLLTPFFVITIFRKSKVGKSIGTVIMAYAVGVIMALFFWLSDMFSINVLSINKVDLKELQDLLMKISVPLAIPLMLFSSNFKLWAKSLPKAVTALCTGVAAVVVAVVISFLIFKNKGITDLNKIAGMMTGLYTGGAMNFAALKSILKTDETIATLTSTLEMIIIFPFLLFITAGGYKLFRLLLPFKDPLVVVDKNDPNDHSVLVDVEDYNKMFSKKIFPKTMLGFLLSVGFLVIGAGLSLLITGKLNELVVIFTITTLAILASFNEKIRNLPKTFELGMFFILIFSVIMASQFDVSKLNSEAIKIFLFVLSISLFVIILHVILCRIFKVSGDLFTVAIIALICSPPFVPPIVAAMGNRKVLISGITIGLVGYAVGNYLGTGIAYLLGLF